jgi:hypothetical protein
MATKSQIADWLEWADKKLQENGGNSQPSNWDKLNAPFVINKYKNWQEVYNAILQDYTSAGATPEEVATATPNRTKSEQAKKKKTAKKLQENASALDPFGEEAVKKYGLIVNVDENGNQAVKGIVPGSTESVPMYVYTTTRTGLNVKTPGDSVGMPKATTDQHVFVETDYNKIRAEILNDAQKTPGGLDGLFKKLYDSGSISKSTFESKNISAPDFDKGLQYLVNQFSISAVNDYSVYGKTDVKTFGDWMANDFKGAGKTSRTTYDMVITNRQDAASDIDQFFVRYVGRPATKAEHDEYYKLLNAAERKAVQYTTTTSDGGRTITGQNLNETDVALLMGKVAGSAIKGSDIDTLMKSGAGAAQDVDTILAHARDYGVKLSREQVTKYVADNLRNGTNTDATKAKIIEIAKSNYKGYADKISDNVSVKELASNYIYQKADTLELNPNTIDIFDGNIQDAINGNMSMTDFNKLLRQNPSWAKTKNAKEEAAKYATSILESFGLMA